MRRLLLAAALAWLSCSLFCSALAAAEFALKEREIQGRAPAVAGWWARGSLQMGQQRPPQLKKLPDISGKAFYGFASLAGNQVPIVLDLTDPPKLYIDTDVDGDLSSEEPFAGTLTAARRGSRSRNVAFGRIVVRMTKPEAVLKLNIGTGRVSGQQVYLQYSPSVYRSGTIVLGGRNHRVEVVDSSFDGRYDTVFSLDAGLGADWLGIDLNGDGVISGGVFETGELLPLPKAIDLGGAYYSLKVAADGSSIQVEQFEPRFGTLDTKSSDAELKLISENGFFRLRGDQGPWRLPAGSYWTVEVILKREDEKGDKWKLTSRWNTGRLRNIAIADGETTSLEMGAPLTGRVTLQAVDGQVRLGYSVLGRGGESYPAGADKNGRRQPAPRFKILSDAGKELASSSFEYG